MQLTNLAVLFFAAFAAAQSTTTSAEPPKSSVQTCLEGCDPTDVICRSQCVLVPYPSEADMNAATQCVAACDASKGIEEYTSCTTKCISQHVPIGKGTNTPASPTGSPTGTPKSGVNGTGTQPPGPRHTSSNGTVTDEHGNVVPDEGAASSLTFAPAVIAAALIAALL